MNFGQQILFFVSALGAFNGFVLSLYIFLRKKGRSLTTVFLGIMLMAISIRVASSVMLYFNPSMPKLDVQMSLAACFLIGPAVYHFFRSALTKAGTPFISWKKTWAVLGGLLILGGFFIPFKTYPGACQIVAAVVYLQWSGYLIASGVLLRNVIRNFLKNRSSVRATEKLWLLIFAGNCIIFLVYLASMLNLTIVEGMCVSGAVAFSLFLYLTVFFNLYGVKMEDILQIQEAGQALKPERRRIAETDAQTWIGKLEKAIAEKELYKDPNLKLSDLAQKINISAHQLSQLLNDNLGKSFSTYINEYRITEACKLISRDGRLSFEAIGYEVGYNSKSTFYSAFKKIKDTTPALFKETVQKEPAK